MGKKHFSAEQIAFALRIAESGTVAASCRRLCCLRPPALAIVKLRRSSRLERQGRLGPLRRRVGGHTLHRAKQSAQHGERLRHRQV